MFDAGRGRRLPPDLLAGGFTDSTISSRTQ